MKLTPWKKRNEVTDQGTDGGSALSRFRSEVDTLFDRFFSDPWGTFDRTLSSFGGRTGWRPSLDVVDGEKELTVKAELPGIDPEDVHLSLSGRTLTISGEKKHEKEEKGQGFYRSECHYGSFRRSVELPDGVDPDKVSADYVNGVLTVRVGKSKAVQAKRIPVTPK